MYVCKNEYCVNRMTLTKSEAFRAVITLPQSPNEGEIFKFDVKCYYGDRINDRWAVGECWQRVAGRRRAGDGPGPSCGRRGRVHKFEYGSEF